MTDREKLAHEAWNVWDLDHHMANKPNEITAAKITACVAAAIAAAEERGRRSGVEGLTDAKVLLTEIRHELLRMDGGHGSIAELPANLRRASTVARLSNAIRALDAALAPRDSALHVGITDEKIRELLLRGERDRCMAEGNNVAPRDSGKDADELMRALRDGATVSTRPPTDRK